MRATARLNRFRKFRHNTEFFLFNLRRSCYVLADPAMRQTGEIDMKLDLTTGAAGGAVASRAHQARLHAEDRGRSLPSRSIVVMPAKAGIQR
jgi:hypothetical protein